MYVFNYENYEPKSTRQQKIRSNDFTNLLPRVQLWYYERSMTSDEALCRTIVLDIDCRNWSTALGIAANQNYQGNIRDFAIRHEAHYAHPFQSLFVYSSEILHGKNSSKGIRGEESPGQNGVSDLSSTGLPFRTLSPIT